MRETAHNPYAAPASGTAAQRDDAAYVATYAPALFGLRGRIGRGRYLVYSLFPACAMLLLVLPLMMFWAMLPLLAAQPALMLHVLLTTLRRLDDLDRSRWWALLACVPALNALLVLYLLCAAGNPQANRHGPAPTASVEALTRAAWLFVAALPCIAFLLYGFIGFAMPV